jgi:ribose-phosphate pyrophosphokinase
MSHFKVFSGSSHEKFAQAICDNLGSTLGKIDRRTFSCGEKYIRFEESFRGQDVFLVQTSRTNNTDTDYMELFLMIDAAKKSFAKKIHVVIPYFGYSRQDKIHAPREGISARLMANLILAAGADRILTVHLHSDQIQGFFNCPVDNLNPRKMFVDYFKKKNLKDVVIVSPDAGGAKMAKKFADDLGVSLAIMHKQRPEHNVSEITHIIGDVKGKIPIIIDDMVDTAGSVCGAKAALVKAGAKDEVYFCATHPIFSGPARERLTEANFAEIICTDSIPVENPPKNFKVLSMAPLISNVINNIIEDKSVSGLYL